jgi:hypothetical protein
MQDIALWGPGVTRASGTQPTSPAPKPNRDTPSIGPRTPGNREDVNRGSRDLRQQVTAAAPTVYGSSVMVSWEESSAFEWLTTWPRAPT